MPIDFCNYEQSAAMAGRKATLHYDAVAWHVKSGAAG
jgi:hypothetical protein